MHFPANQIEKTRAIVLRVIPYSQTSHIVNWLTTDSGTLATLVKGASRPKSAYLGQYDLFYTCELLYYTRARNHLHMIRECSPIHARPQLRLEWRSAACASYCCDLARRTVPQGVPQLPLYALLESVLELIAHRAATPSILFWYELRFLEQMGLWPRLDACVSCGRAVPAPPPGPLSFDTAGGGVVCKACVQNRAITPIAMGVDILALLRTWQATEDPKAALRVRCSDSQSRQIDQILGGYMTYHLDLEMAARRIAMRMLTFTPQTLNRKRQMSPSSTV